MTVKSKLSAVFFLLLYVDKCHSCAVHERPVLSLTGNVMRSVRNIKFLNQDGPLELFCSGRDAERLKLSFESGTTVKRLPTETVNETTVKFYKEEKEKQLALYRCWDTDAFCMSAMFLVIDVKPDFRDFYCVSRNFIYLNCSWTSTNVLAIFNVYLLNKEPLKICRIVLKEVTSNTRYCMWKYNNDPAYKTERTLSISLETCSNFDCSNKTVEVVHLSIVKLDPPVNVRLLSKSSHSVKLEWEIPYETRKLLEGVEHRVEYRYPGIQPLEINTTSVTNKLTKYRLNVNLPCANQYYEVNISMRPKQATKEEYWSDFATISFVTDQNIEKDDEVIETCEKFDVDLTPEIMLYELDKLRTKIMAEQAQVKILINKLRAKDELITFKQALRVLKEYDGL